ncbi:hypothetical protein ABZZ36_28855 [Actinacidiphila glaucinigra]|uniref:hypothetical protein n=1 Tax=Actinacidiphila glaucinigra TaxID=235986 RepID=UPI0033BBFD2C
MDMQGVGAIAAAAVAATTVPITLLVGRWQVRAAIQAGDAAYRAAVDAAHQQGTAAHSQWRREVRREAYTALLLATQQASVLAGDIHDRVLSADDEEIRRRKEELARACKAITDPFVVVELEGPDSVIEAARALVPATTRNCEAARRAVDYARAMRYFTEHQRTSGVDPMADSPWSRLLDAVNNLRHQAEAAPPEHFTSWNSPLWEVSARLDTAGEAFPSDEAQMHIASFQRGVRWMREDIDAADEAKATREEFLRRVREVLD